MKTNAVLLALWLIVPPRAFASETSREFVTSCTYGALAGTLVGAASLAFTKRPGDNLNHVARGASLGLYAGILLGTYVAFIVPRLGRGGDEVVDAAPSLIVAPVLAQNRVDGVEINVNVFKF